MISKFASTAESLLDELQTTLTHGTVARRVETLRRVTDLFINGAVEFSDDQIELFDDVFQCLILHIETSAKALLAIRLVGRRRSHRGRSAGAVAIGAARRGHADRNCTQQEPSAFEGDFDT